MKKCNKTAPVGEIACSYGHMAFGGLFGKVVKSEKRGYSGFCAIYIDVKHFHLWYLIWVISCGTGISNYNNQNEIISLFKI